MSRYVRAAAADRTMRLGFAGGVITSLSGVVGYVVVPLVQRGGFALDVGLVPIGTLWGSPLWYHLLVVGVAPLVGGVVGALASPVGQTSDRWTLVKLLAGNVLLPVVTAISLAVLSGVSLAAGVALGVAEPGEGVITFLLALVFVLAWGALVTLPVVTLVVFVTAAGTSGGYLLGLALVTVRRRAVAGDR